MGAEILKENLFLKVTCPIDTKETPVQLKQARDKRTNKRWLLECGISPLVLITPVMLLLRKSFEETSFQT